MTGQETSVAGHVIEPDEDRSVYSVPVAEPGGGTGYPHISVCVCGRAIVRRSPGGDWTHLAYADSGEQSR